MSEDTDDISIGNGTDLWRRIPNWPKRVVYDENLGRQRPSSSNFDDHPNGTPMSVAIADGSVTACEALAEHPQFFLVGFTAGMARSLGLGVVRRPLPGQAWHGEVPGKKTGRVKNELARAAIWVVAPK